jgi:hypothetical protein
MEVWIMFQKALARCIYASFESIHVCFIEFWRINPNLLYANMTFIKYLNIHLAVKKNSN